MSLLWQDIVDGSFINSTSCIDFCYENKTIVLACLPTVLSELAGISGFNNAFKLAREYGGRKIYLPKHARDFFTLCGINLEEEEYQCWRRLARVNGQIEISSKWGVFLALRRAAIYLALKSGASNEEIILSFGITQRQLRTLRSKYGYSCSPPYTTTLSTSR